MASILCSQSHPSFSQMAPCRKQSKQKLKKIHKANIAVAIQAVREKRAKNLLAAAGQFNVPYHILCRRAPQQLLEIRGLATALQLPKTGLKAEVFQQILQQFDDNPDLNKNPRYEGLFNPTHSCKCRVSITGIAPLNYHRL